jgi:hypothetical protein
MWNISNLQTTNMEILHWDGPNLMYTIFQPSSGHQANVMDDFKVNDLSGNTLADINPTTGAMVVWDRDMTGTVVSSHNASGFGGWNAPDAYAQRCEAGLPPSSTTYANTYVNANPFGPITSSGSDGFATAFTTFEGVRAWDTVTTQWTGPTLRSRGGSGAPATWHKNNWLAYIDPSGVSARRNPLGLSVTSPGSNIATRSLISASPGTTSSVVTGPSQLPNAAPGSIGSKGAFSVEFLKGTPGPCVNGCVSVGQDASNNEFLAPPSPPIIVAAYPSDASPADIGDAIGSDVGAMVGGFIFGNLGTAVGTVGGGAICGGPCAFAGAVFGATALGAAGVTYGSALGGLLGFAVGNITGNYLNYGGNVMLWNVGR